MAVANVLAASTMKDASFGEALLLAVAILVAGAAIGAVNGLLVVISRVPDVIVTLTTGFIWGGVALLILEKPGGGAPPEFLNLGTGTLITDWLSNSLVLLVVALAAVWIPVRRSKTGLRIYATGSDRIAAFRSGVNVELARLVAYVLGGLFSAIGGVGLTMTTGIGSPHAGVLYTLSGLAAVVIGGVSLTGGRGGIVGPVIAAFVLTLIPADLIFLNIDPNFGQVIQGTLIVLVVMAGGLATSLRETANERSVGRLGAAPALRGSQHSALVSAQHHRCSGPAAPAVYRDRRAHEAGHGQSGVAVEHAPVRGAARHSCRGSDHGDVDRRDRSFGRQRRHRLGIPDDDDGAEVRQWSGGRDRPRAGAGGRSDQRRRRRSARRSAAGDDARHRADDGRHHHRLQPEDIGVALDRARLHPRHRIRPPGRPHSSRRILYGCRLRRWWWSRWGKPASAACCTRSATIATPAGWPACACGGSSSSTTSFARCSRRSPDSSSSATPIPPISAWPPPTSCLRSRRSSSAAPRSSAAAAAIPARIVGALILTVLDGLLTLLDSPEPIKQILYGAIIFALAAAYSRLTG